MIRRWALVIALWLAVPVTTEAQARPRTYVVREGDTLARIARRHHSSVEAIREANRLRGDAVRAGQELIVPREGEDPRALRSSRGARPARETPAQREARGRARRIGLGTVRAGQSLLVRAPQRRWITAAGEGPRLSGTLRLPVDRGRLIRGWGSGDGGYHLAIDIRGRVGATIRAAERGIVAYAGDGLGGYGNFVILVHPNGWVTAYAHNRENLVVAGQVVRRGEAIARLGNTGTSQAPHLHFVLVDGGAHCDAVPLFDPPIARSVTPAAWRDERPESVQCLRRSERPHPSHAEEDEAPVPDDESAAEDEGATEDEAPADEP
ncbi:peptidoglycan DD-metalloendopeptidase family protein [Sandaracinus amylolyticus]|uniref:peptidoglycan DD-metalloendopeptidase family protein n=1 Tax=Sandaracinus amylolyticus TaxID=927083 RepID=UPI001F2DB558|nr:M23 family metallopeptidase [Sandaracinus amylolyticus]